MTVSTPEPPAYVVPVDVGLIETVTGPVAPLASMAVTVVEPAKLAVLKPPAPETVTPVSALAPRVRVVSAEPFTVNAVIAAAFKFVTVRATSPPIVTLVAAAADKVVIVLAVPVLVTFSVVTVSSVTTELIANLLTVKPSVADLTVAASTTVTSLAELARDKVVRPLLLITLLTP